MAHVLTYDPTPADAEEFSEEEKDSLAVGEKIEEQQDTLLANKFKDAEELEKAYLELQQKLGSKDQENTEEKAEVVEEEKEEDPSVTLLTDATYEFNEKGELSEETLSKFNDMSSQELVAAYMEVQRNAPKQEEAVADLTDSEIRAIKDVAGGEEGYDKIIEWAGDALSDDESEGFDSLIASGNTHAIQLAVAGLKAKYDESNGYEGRMLSGKPAQNSSDQFRSQAEVVRAMQDPRYDNDPAYRQDIYDKLERSNLKF